jgi:hypothetical protein
MPVPREAPVRQDEGSHHLTLDSAACERRGRRGELVSPAVPVIGETLDVHTAPEETGRLRI